MMGRDLLAGIDICAVVAAVAIIFLSWFYLPHETFSWSVILAGLIIALAATLTLNYLLSAIIADRRKANGKTGSAPKRPWLAFMNYAAVIIIPCLLALFWFYIPREMIGWGIWFAFLLFLLVCIVNAFGLLADFADSGKTAA